MDNNYKTDLSKTMSPDSPVGLSPQGLIENRAVTSCLPTSPLRGTFNPSGSVFNFPYSQPIDTMPFESQLLQRIQTLSGYNSPSPFSYNYNQSLPFLSSTLYNQPLLNNNYTLQSAPQMKIPQSPLALRHSYTTNTETGTKLSPTKYSEPRQMSASQYQTQSNPVQYQQTQQNSQYEQQQQSTQKQSIQRLKMPENRQQRVPNPNPQECSQNERKESQFIKPLAQMGTLTTTDTEGRVRIIVPVPSNSNDTANLLLNLSLTDDLRPLNRPTITRSTSEKVPNRSELMSQVQRGAWARHTTK